MRPLRLSSPSLLRVAVPVVLLAALSSQACRTKACAQNDLNCDEVPDDIGAPFYDPLTGAWAEGDFNGDGIGDGPAINENGDDIVDGVGLDTNHDGYIDSIDRNGDGFADKTTGIGNVGAGGSIAGAGGSIAGVGGSASGGSHSSTGSCLTAAPVHSSGQTVTGVNTRYFTADTWRQACADPATCPGVSYKFIANGWGVNWVSHTISFEGSRFTVDDLQGSRSPDFGPASYPSAFCGLYSGEQSSQVSGPCGLPAPIASLARVGTGLRWSHTGGQGSDFNVAYDIWMGNGTSFAGFLMVWLHDPPANQPAGGLKASKVTVGSDPTEFNVWTGTVNGSPIVNYVRAEGQDLSEFSFNVLDFVTHAKANHQLPGDTIQSVAIGFEIWSGPVTNLKVEDFCVDVQAK